MTIAVSEFPSLILPYTNSYFFTKLHRFHSIHMAITVYVNLLCASMFEYLYNLTACRMKISKKTLMMDVGLVLNTTLVKPTEEYLLM